MRILLFNTSNHIPIRELINLTVLTTSSKNMSSTAPSSSSTMSLPSHEVSSNRLFQFYLESFFKIPKDISNDIIYCQRALKAHIKVHQMVLDVFQQQTDADPEQKTRILDELRSEIYEINAEQSFLFLRLRRIKDEFIKMLMKNDIAIDSEATNAFISKELVPQINKPNLAIMPTTVMLRNDEDKLIEKYFEVQKETKTHEYMEVIDLDDDEAMEIVQEPVVRKTYSNSRKRNYNNSASTERESLLKNLQSSTAAPQASLLKPFNQRMSHDSMSTDVKPNINKPIKTLGDYYKKKKEEKLMHQKMSQELMAVDVKPNIIKPVKTVVGDVYQKKTEEETDMGLNVSTNVIMSRFNLRQALKRAQAAVRGPTNAVASHPTSTLPPPPLKPPTTVPSSSSMGVAEVVRKKSNSNKTKVARAAASTSAAASGASASGTRKSPVVSSSSGENTPERGHTPPNNYWPDEFEETRTKAEEYGQENFLKLFDLFTPELQARMQQRRSKRRRRCVQNNNYHYGRIESHPSNPANELDNKKRRKAFLLSPQVKKFKRTKRRSADNVSETNSAPTSRSNSSSPNEKRLCNECLKTGLNLEQCEGCKLFFHARCHHEEDKSTTAVDYKKHVNDLKKCPSCTRKYEEKAIQEGILQHKNLQRSAQDLELKLAKEKDRHEILERTSKSYKIQMHNIFEIVKSLKTEASSSFLHSANKNSIAKNEDSVIQLD